jgi:hypothetical protein
VDILIKAWKQKMKKEFRDFPVVTSREEQCVSGTIGRIPEVLFLV